LLNKYSGAAYRAGHRPFRKSPAANARSLLPPMPGARFLAASGRWAVMLASNLKGGARAARAPAER
jgi:hypothetical protein